MLRQPLFGLLVAILYRRRPSDLDQRLQCLGRPSMKRPGSRSGITRRRFAFWLGPGLFNLGELLRADVFDDLAAGSMRAAAEPPTPRGPCSTPKHWSAAENNSCRWFEREHLIDGHGNQTGIMTPIHKQTGEPYTGRDGYLDDNLVSGAVRRGDQAGKAGLDADTFVEVDAGQPNFMRRARYGRRLSRSLHATNYASG